MTLWLAALVAASGCLEGREYPCATDLECRVDGLQGTCHTTGFCAYPDGRCPSDLRYGPAAGDGLAFECVPSAGGGNESNAFVEDSSGAATSAAADGTTAASATSAESGGCGACAAPPNDCFEAAGTCEQDGCVYEPEIAGTSCVLADPCVLAAVCDGAGNCLVTRGMTCDNPPGPCDSSRGVCGNDGSCDYEKLPPDSPCDDGDGCTTGETCDGAGVCGGGDPCVSDDPCESASCVAGECQFAPLGDGEPCGNDSADRCCDGTCVDISSDETNCGGCGASCDADDTCESVALTASCEFAPAATTGRCSCDAANADCPLGQVCRSVAPFTNRCTPNDATNCVNAFQDVNLCPNYCFYP